MFLCFRCGSEDHFINFFLKLNTSDNKFYCNTEKPKTRAYISMEIYKTSEDSTDEIESHKIYASMEHISSNVESPRNNYGDSSQLTNSILDSGATCYMSPDISDFIPE